MKEIQLSKQGKNKGRYVALVDDEDFESLNQFRWSVTIRKNIRYAFRNVRINNKRTVILLHNQILNCKKIDHKDHDGLNNQKINLRKCTSVQNQMNQMKHIFFSSKFKGVSWFKPKKKWRVTICLNKKQTHIGYFSNEIEAAKSYDEAAKKYFKEFAYLNFKNKTE